MMFSWASTTREGIRGAGAQLGAAQLGLALKKNKTSKKIEGEKGFDCVKLAAQIWLITNLRADPK